MPIEVTGIQSTLKDMRKFEPDLHREMNKQIKRAMIPVRNKAKSFAPSNQDMLSNWTKVKAFGPQQTQFRPFPMYNQAETIRGIIYSAGGDKPLPSGFQVLHYVANRSAGGAIYETAGRVHPSGRKQTHIVVSRHKLLKDKKYRTQRGTRIDMNSNNPNAGKQFLEPLGRVYGARGNIDPRFGNTDQRGRLVYRAWSEDQGKVTRAIQLAIDIAVKTFNARDIASSYSKAA